MMTRIAVPVTKFLALSAVCAVLSGCSPKNPFRDVDQSKALADARAEVGKMTGNGLGSEQVFTLHSNALMALRAIEPTRENQKELRDLYESTYPNFSVAHAMYKKKRGEQ
jgi:hypothetical protein